MTNPSVIPTQGQQDRETPADFFEIVNRRWPICFDLAATYKNKKHISFFGLQKNGAFDDALEKDWTLICNVTRGHGKKWLWLNLPAGQEIKFLKKCISERKKGCRIITLIEPKKKFQRYILDNSVIWIIELYGKKMNLCEWEFGRVGLGTWNWELG